MATQASPWSDHGGGRDAWLPSTILLGRHRQNHNISRFPQCFETRERSLFAWPRFYRPLHPRWGYRFYPVGPTDLPDLEGIHAGSMTRGSCDPKAEPHPKTGQQCLKNAARCLWSTRGLLRVLAAGKPLRVLGEGQVGNGIRTRIGAAGRTRELIIKGVIPNLTRHRQPDHGMTIALA